MFLTNQGMTYPTSDSDILHFYNQAKAFIFDNALEQKMYVVLTTEVEFPILFKFDHSEDLDQLGPKVAQHFGLDPVLASKVIGLTEPHRLVTQKR